MLATITPGSDHRGPSPWGWRLRHNRRRTTRRHGGGQGQRRRRGFLHQEKPILLAFTDNQGSLEIRTALDLETKGVMSRIN